MLIVGAKGFAKELLEVVFQNQQTKELVFFDNVSTDIPNQLYGEFRIVRSEKEVRHYFENISNKFTLGIGNPILRNQLCRTFESWGGELTSVISSKANIGSFGISIGSGASILDNSNITTDVVIGRGLLMYPNSIITHDCKIGDFVELSPGSTILGHCKIGNNVHIGANATILPNIIIEDNSVVGAGAVVTKNVASNLIVKGIPAK